MKKYLLIMIFLLFASTAQAGIYISGNIGFNFHNDSKTICPNARYDYKSSPLMSAAFGYAFPVVPVRTEIEGLYSKNKMQERSNHMTTGGAFLNAYVHIPLLGAYVGAGGGYASVRNKATPVYQGMMGMEYGLFGINLGVEYRHVQSAKNIRKFNEESSLRTDALLLKLRFEF